MRRTHISLTLALTPLILAACSDSSGPVETTHVSMQDQCDPASFNAALGAGTCTRQGNVTFAAFNSELNAKGSVAAWRYVPSTLMIHVGQAITAMNDGGETHTFTEVDNFGGGIVPSLNQASGNTTTHQSARSSPRAILWQPERHSPPTSRLLPISAPRSISAASIRGCGRW